MHFPDLTIGKTDDPKGRTFSVHYVASIQAPDLCPPAPGGATRPVLLAYAGSSSAIRAFTANLRAGLTARTSNRRFELLRSLGYKVQLTSPAPGKALVLAYLPDLFHLQPGVEEHDSLRFLLAPPLWWLDRQEALLAPDYGSRARDLALAMAFVARLDARTPLPIANDPDFHHALFEAALDESWTATGDDRRILTFDGLEHLGLAAPVLCDVPRHDFAAFLASATARLLPPLPAASLETPRPRFAAQLALNFLTA